MSLLSSLFGNNENTNVNHPCSNCPSSCSLSEKACDVCKPYKEKLIDAMYRVEHKDEIIAQYEVVGTTQAATGTYICPHCMGPSTNRFVCDYCGSQLEDGTGKIQVASASEIPNPVIEAEDLIYDRYNAVSEYANTTNNQGILASLFEGISELLGQTESEEYVLGSKMSEAEIEEAAELYGVSVYDYLIGLDSGKYLTLTGKQNKDAGVYSGSESTGTGTGTVGLGILGAGIAGAGLAGAAASNNHRPPKPQDDRPPMPQNNGNGRPEGNMRPDNNRPKNDNFQGMNGRPEMRNSGSLNHNSSAPSGSFNHGNAGNNGISHNNGHGGAPSGMQRSSGKGNSGRSGGQGSGHGGPSGMGHGPGGRR